MTIEHDHLDDDVEYSPNESEKQIKNMIVKVDVVNSSKGKTLYRFTVTYNDSMTEQIRTYTNKKALAEDVREDILELL